MGCSRSGSGRAGSCCLGRRERDAWQLPAVSFPSPRYQVVPQAPQHLGQLSPCLVMALLPALLCGCLCGFAAGWSPPFPTASLGLADLAGYVGVFLGKPSGFSQAGSLAGAGGSASRRQPAKPCCESAWPINI